MRRADLGGKWQFLAFLLLACQTAFAQPESNKHTLPLVMPASNPVQQGFVRIINHSNEAGTVQIHAIDDSGQRFGPISLDLEAKASAHFNSGDLESGNEGKGLSDGVGDGDGDWRLELETTLDIEPLGYIRTEDGFVTSMHDLVVQGASMYYHVPFFNPGSNQAQVSQLRLINTTDTENEVTIIGLDDDGEPAEDNVRLTLPGDGARTVTAQELESGGSNLVGRFGDGAGKWHLFVSAEHPVQLLNMLRSPTGSLTNLSTSTSDGAFDPPDFAPADQAAFDARFVGKRWIFDGDPLAYWNIVSSGRLVDSEEGGGSYTYQNTGTNAGTFDVLYDSGDHCPGQIAFTSATKGTLTYACGGGEAETTTWELVDIADSGFAPADQAAFDARFVGKRWLLPGEEYVDFVSPGRFVLKDRDPVPDPGSYTYSRTGRNTGTFDYQQDEDRGTGVRCMLQITFVTAISGNFTLSCTDGEGGEGTWRTVDIPAAGFAPADQAAFDTRFVGKRWSIALPLNSGESLDLVWYFISSGRFEEYEDGERTERGTYTYQNTGPNTGDIPFHNIHSDGPGPLHTWNVTFDSATAGTLRIVSDGTLLTGSWRVAGT